MGVPDVVVNSKDQNKNLKIQKVLDIDTALVLTGHKWFHWKLLMIGGFGFLATGFEFTLHAYILPFAKCDLHIDAARMGIINALFLGGGLVSSLFWGLAADAWGRRRMLVSAMILEGICTLISSFSINFYIFAAVRTLCGFLCGSGATILLSYVGEFCSNEKRPRNICALGFAWTMSWILLPGMAAVVLPLSFELDAGFMTYRAWRLFVALVGMPNIIAGLLLYFFLPESPKYFFASGEEEKALAILANMYAENTGNRPEEYAVSHLYNPDRDDVDVEKSAQDEKPPKRKKPTLGELWRRMLSQMKMVFCPPLLWSTLLSCSVYICGMFGFYGLGLWLPSLFDRFEDFYKAHPNETVSVCELTRALDATAQNITSYVMDCSQEVNISVFTNTFIIGTGCFVGNSLATYLASRIPARLLTAGLVGVAGTCVFAIYFVTSPIAIVAMSAIFMGAGNAGLSVHNTCAINLFPTSIRGMGICVSFLAGRISAVLSSMIFGLLIDVQCEIPVFMVGSIVLLGSGFALLIPKSSQKARE